MLQKNALQILSRADPTRAFGMVDQMDEPVPLDREIPEDLRAFVTQFIYPSCWAAKPSAARLESIRRQARALSADGQYPVQGILPVFEYLSQRDPAGAQGWWSEIVDWYARDRGAIQDTDRVFVTFLKAAWNDVGPAERRHALETAAKRLARQPESPPPSDRPVYRAKADTTAGQFVLHGAWLHPTIGAAATDPRDGSSNTERHRGERGRLQQGEVAGFCGPLH